MKHNTKLLFKHTYKAFAGATLLVFFAAVSFSKSSAAAPESKFELSQTISTSKRADAMTSIIQSRSGFEANLRSSVQSGVNVWKPGAPEQIIHTMTAPGEIAGRKTAIIVADQLKFESRNLVRNRLSTRQRNGVNYRRYSHAGWSNLILVVNELTVSGCNLIDVTGESHKFRGLLTSRKCAALSQRASASAWVNSRQTNPRVANHVGRYLSMGGRVSLFVRTLICEPGGMLVIDASSKDNALNQAFPGGDIRLVVENTQGENCVRTRSKGVAGGKSGAVEKVSSLSDIEGKWQALKTALSFWKVEMLKRISDHLIVAEAQDNLFEIAKQYHVYRQIAACPVLPKHALSTSSLMRALNRSRKDILPGLVEKQVQIEVPNSPNVVDISVVIDTKDFSAYAIPNLALLVPREIQSDEYLGVIEFDPENEGEILLWLEVDLEIDPFLESLLVQNLAKDGWKFSGQFSNWVLSPAGLEGEVEGLKSASIVPKADGRGFSVSLRLDSNVSNLFLARIASQSGLPLGFDWHYKPVPSIRGNWNNVSVTLARRRSSNVELINGKLFNNGVDPLTLNYLKRPSGYEYLVPAVQVLGKSDMEIEGELDGAQSVSDSAIEYQVELNSYLLERRFFIANKDVLLQSVSIENLLGYDADRGGRLEAVEIYVKFESDAGMSKTRGPIRLAPAGADGDRITLLFFGSASAGSFSLSGKVFYEHGSYQRLKEIETTSPTIKIKANMLPALARGEI